MGARERQEEIDWIHRARARDAVYARDRAACEARAKDAQLREARIAVLETGIRDAVRKAPDLFAGLELDFRGLATAIVSQWEA